MTTNPTISARLDYYRSVHNDKETVEALARGHFHPDNTERHPPLYGYAVGYRNVETSAVLLTQPHHNTMGNCVQCGGTSLLSIETLYAMPSWKALISFGLAKAKVKRLDVAIDVINGDCSGQETLRRLNKGEASTNVKTWNVVEGGGNDKGFTLYLGSRASKKSVRIYDKGAEQRLNLNWWRYEMVFTDERAQELWQSIIQLDTPHELLYQAKSLLSSIIVFPQWKAWNELFNSGDSFDWAEIPRKEAERWTWLIEQVAPTFIEAMDKDGDWRLLDRFIQTIKAGQQ